MHLIEGRRTGVDLIVRTDDEAGAGSPRLGLRSTDVACQLKRAGLSTWQEKELSPANWQEAGHGVYVLTLEPGDFDASGPLTVLVAGAPALKPAIVPMLASFEVAEARQSAALPIPQTILCGRVITLDQKGKIGVAITARVVQLPVVISGAAVTNDVVTVETNEDGYFELPMVTSANIVVQSQVLAYQKQFIVPPPPAQGIPVKLFSL